MKPISELVDAESERADAKWSGVAYTDYLWVCILTEEVGEVARAIHDSHYRRSAGDTEEGIVAELVQVASVAIRFAEWIRHQEAAAS